MLTGFRLSNPNYSPAEISHMVQTCWLPDPNERPTFTMLKQTSWQVLSSFDTHDSSANPTPFTINKNDEMLTRYKQIKSCNPVVQRQNIKDRRRQYDSNHESVSTQIYADLESKCKTYYFKNGAETVMYSNEANNGTIPSLFPNGDKLLNHVRYKYLRVGFFEMFKLPNTNFQMISFLHFCRDLKTELHLEAPTKTYFH